MNETTSQSLSRDDVRTIVSEEIGKVGDLLGLGIFIDRLESERPLLELSENNSVVASGHLDVVLDEIVVHLDLGVAPVVLKRQGDGWVEPNCDRPRPSVVVRADARDKESFSFAKAHHRGELDNHEKIAVREVERGAATDNSSHFRPSPSVDDAGAHSVGDGPGAGGASASPATDVTDPHISVRYDAPLNAIAMSVGGTDDLYFDRDATFLLIDELRAALHDQAKNGGLA